MRAEPDRRFSVADLIAGFSVTLILIPPSMAYAELAGLPSQHGLYAAALPPIAAAIFASSAYLQTGPVALTALLTLGALSPLAPPGSAVVRSAGETVARRGRLTDVGTDRVSGEIGANLRLT